MSSTSPGPPTQDRPTHPLTRWITYAEVADEPYRLFFPIGCLVGLTGVLLWTLFYMELLPVYPVLVHERVMVLGFFGAFTLGFIGTALPRMTQTARLRPLEVTILAALLGLMLVLYLAQPAQPIFGDLLALLLLLAILGVFLPRIWQAQQPLAPSFALTGLAWLVAVVGLGLMLWPYWPQGQYVGFQLGRTLLNETAVLLLFIGSVPVIIPRLFGFTHRLPQSNLTIGGQQPGRLNPRTMQTIIIWLAGAGVILTFVIESFMHSQLGQSLRFVFVAGYFLLLLSPNGTARLIRDPLTGGTAIALAAIAAAPLLELLGPHWRQIHLHTLFILGFGLLTLLVGWQVASAHSMRPSAPRRQGLAAVVLVLLVLASLISRTLAEFQPQQQPFWIGKASTAWMLALIFWAVLVMPSALRKNVA